MRSEAEAEAEKIVDQLNLYLGENRQRPLTQAQQWVLMRCLIDPTATYPQMAQGSRFQWRSLKSAASDLFTILGEITGQDVAKATCGRVVRLWCQQARARQAANLIGREPDLEQLLAAIEQGQRLICLNGPPRSGKSELVRALWRQLAVASAQSQGFERHISCPVADLPTVDDLYQYVLAELAAPSASPPAAGAETALTRLLRQHRLLLVMEKADTLNDPASLEGRFKPVSASYESWLSNLTERLDLQSCVVWVCRRQPHCLQSNRDWFFQHSLQPLPSAAAEAILQARGLRQTRAQLEQLAAFCGYNPGLLRMAADKIQTVYNNSIDEFLSSPFAVEHPEERLWQQTLNDLTLRERRLLGWLLLHPYEPLQGTAKEGTREGAGDLLTPLQRQALQVLCDRGLAQRDAEGRYALQSPWLQHLVAQQQALQLAAAVADDDLVTLDQHPLIAPEAPFGRRQWHWQQVLRPAAERLTADTNWGRSYWVSQLNALLDQLRQRPAVAAPALSQGYAAGNLLNLAIALELPLELLNFSGLLIRHGDAWSSRWRGQLKVEASRFSTTLLPVFLASPLVMALSPSGKLLVVGDSAGRLLCWQRQGSSFQLYRFARLPAAAEPLGITKLAFGSETMLAVGAGRALYRWWLGEAGSPELLTLTPALIASLACRGDECVAAGLTNGQICLWQEMGDPQLLQHHRRPVKQVVISDYSNQAASIGYGDRVLFWELDNPQGVDETIGNGQLFITAAWQQNQLLTASSTNGSHLLRLDGDDPRPLNFAVRHDKICFSRSGHYFAADSSSGVYVSPCDRASTHHCLRQVLEPKELAVSNDGQWLVSLSTGEATVQVWQVETGQLYWQLAALPAAAGRRWPYLEASSLAGAGLSEAEQAYWADCQG